MSIIKYVFTPNLEKYEGVRPINIYLLRLLYFLMFVRFSSYVSALISRIDFVLIFIRTEFDSQVVNVGFVKARNQFVNQLDIVLDAMVFADEDDVMTSKLPDHVILWRFPMRLEKCNQFLFVPW